MWLYNCILVFQVLYELNKPLRCKAVIVQISRNAHFNVDQPSDLVDEVVNIEIGGLQSQQNVTIHATLENLGNKFDSYAKYQANSEGKVNLATDESFGGTYTGEK